MCPRRAVIICIVVYMDNIFSFLAKTPLRMARRRRQRLIWRVIANNFLQHTIRWALQCLYRQNYLIYRQRLTGLNERLRRALE